MCLVNEIFNEEICEFGDDREGTITFIIPVGKVSQKEAQKTLKELMKSYKETVEFDDIRLSVNEKDESIRDNSS